MVSFAEQVERELDAALALWLLSDDPLRVELARRIGQVMGLSEMASDNCQVGALVFEYVVQARGSYLARVRARAENGTRRVHELDDQQRHLALAWIGWHALVRWELDQRLGVNYRTGEPQGRVIDPATGQAQRNWLVGPYFRARGKGLRKEDLDAYYEELALAGVRVPDRIVRTLANDLPVEQQFRPDSVEDVLAVITAAAQQGIQGAWDEGAPTDAALSVIYARDAQGKVRRDERGKPIRAYVAHVDPQVANQVGWPEEQFSDPEAVVALGVDAQRAHTERQRVRDVIYAWAVDDRAYRDRGVAGAVGHVLYGFTGLERVAIKRCLPLDDAGRLDEATDVEQRHYRQVRRKYRQLLYQIGALGPRRAFDSVETLEAVIASSDQVYRGRRNGNPLLWLLDGVSAAARVLPDGSAARVSPAILAEFLVVPPPPARDAVRDARDLFLKGYHRLAGQPARTHQAVLHDGEHGFAGSLGRTDPQCVEDAGCQEGLVPRQEVGV
jgi:hypothetical protein